MFASLCKSAGNICRRKYLSKMHLEAWTELNTFILANRANVGSFNSLPHDMTVLFIVFFLYQTLYVVSGASKTN